MLTQAAGRIQLFTFVGLKSLLSCRLSLEDHSQLLEADSIPWLWAPPPISLTSDDESSPLIKSTLNFSCLFQSYVSLEMFSAFKDG